MRLKLEQINDKTKEIRSSISNVSEISINQIKPSEVSLLIISYNSKHRKWWDYIIVVFAIYNSIEFPISFAFDSELELENNKY